MNKTTFHKDLTNKTMTVEHSFNAPRSRVWQAWTKSEELEKWWAPKPWKAVTKSFDFREGGRWHYCMQGPSGEKAWAIADYKTIDPENSFTLQDAFCDEEGNIDSTMPSTHWQNDFKDKGETTAVTVTMEFASAADMEKLVATGFETGFTMGLENLDGVLAA